MLILQASISENGTVNGKAGDQTKKEVNESKLKTMNWDYALRFKKELLAESLVKIARAAVFNENIGYSQGTKTNRNSLWVEAKKGPGIKFITKPCNCDCSSLVSVCVNLAYYSAYKKWLLKLEPNCPTTKTLRKRLMETGMFEEIKLPRLANLKPGDILLNEGKHTCIVETID